MFALPPAAFPESRIPFATVGPTTPARPHIPSQRHVATAHIQDCPRHPCLALRPNAVCHYSMSRGKIAVRSIEPIADDFTTDTQRLRWPPPSDRRRALHRHFRDGLAGAGEGGEVWVGGTVLA